MSANIASKIASEASEKLSPRTYVASVVRGLDRKELERLAIEFVMQQVKLRVRSRSRQVEREAEVIDDLPPLTLPSGWRSTGNGWALDAGGNRVHDPRYKYRWEARERKDRAEAMIHDYVARMSLDLKPELLMSRFALGDGSETSWGEATAEQHRYRQEMYTANVVADAEGAARHVLAIQMLEAENAVTLNEVASKKSVVTA
jgi:hypothetical protein